jgi:trigger factor
MASANGERPPIPLPMAREIRQRCGFGCVICGMPLYEYEHMEEWALVQRHVAEEITLLCDQHHREKTNGLLPKEVVAAANLNPWNLREGVSKPYNLHFSGKTAEIELGSNTFTCEDGGYGTAMIPISVDGIPLLGFILGDGHLLLNVVLFDECNDLVLHIQNNVMVYRMNAWDITLIGKTLTIREDQGKFYLEINFLPPSKISISRGRLLCNGVEVSVSAKSIVINNSNTFERCSFHNCNYGVAIGPHKNPVSGAMVMPRVLRYNQV